MCMYIYREEFIREKWGEGRSGDYGMLITSSPLISTEYVGSKSHVIFSSFFGFCF